QLHGCHPAPPDRDLAEEPALGKIAVQGLEAEALAAEQILQLFQRQVSLLQKEKADGRERDRAGLQLEALLQLLGADVADLEGDLPEQVGVRGGHGDRPPARDFEPSRTAGIMHVRNTPLPQCPEYGKPLDSSASIARARNFYSK